MDPNIEKLGLVLSNPTDKVYLNIYGNSMVVQSFSDNCIVTATIKTEVTGNTKCIAISSDKFRSILANFSESDKMQISIDGVNMKFWSDEHSRQITVIPQSEVPDFDQYESESDYYIRDNCGLLANLLQAVSNVAAKEGRGNASCVMVGGNRISATDGIAFLSFEFENELPNLAIPRAQCNLISKALRLDTFAVISISSGRLIFSNSKVNIVFSPSTYEYQDYLKSLGRRNYLTDSLKIPPNLAKIPIESKQMTKILSALSSIFSGDTVQCSIHPKNDSFAIYAESASKGYDRSEFRFSSKGVKEGKPVMVDPRRLSTLLSINPDSILFDSSEPDGKPVYLQTEGAIALLAPMR